MGKAGSILEKKLQTEREKNDIFRTTPTTAYEEYSIGHEPVPTRREMSPRENDNWAVMSTFCCETCMYWLNFRCRRHFPSGQEGWPAVYSTDFCGDHKIAKLKMALLKA